MRLIRIEFRFPSATPGAATFLADLGGLLVGLPGAVFDDTGLHFTPQEPASALPNTTLALAELACPEIAFATEGAETMGPRTIRLGPALAPSRAGLAPATVPLQQAVQQLAGHLTHVDHTGVNLPTAMVLPAGWEAHLAALARVAALYRYPGGEPWPFILPATEEELRGDIGTFVPGRRPKFELVHDRLAALPVLQFALGTDLPPQALEARFPPPQGVSFPDLGHLFRTVYLEHPWSGVLLRLDLYYASDGPPDAWDTGEWLAREGGRIR